MPLISALINLGIRLDSAAQKWSSRSGRLPLQWPAGTGGLIYRLPRDPQQRASIFSATQSILVNDGEMAVVLEDGKPMGALEPGRYVFEKARVIGMLDVIWIRTGQRSVKWGMGNVSAADGIPISANGVVYLRVTEPLSFNREIVQGALTLGEVDLQRTLMPRIASVIRSLIARSRAVQLQQERETFTESIRTQLGEIFPKLGLAMLDFEVVEVNFPPEFQEALAKGSINTQLGAAAVIAAQADFSVKQIEAQAEANRLLMEGMAQADVMARLQAMGIDPLKIEALKALNTMAANPAHGMIGTDLRAGMFASITNAALSPGQQALPPPQLPPTSQPPSLESEQPQQSDAAAPSEPPAPPSQSSDDELAGLQTQLDKLISRLANGDISEENYEKISLRLEARIAQLKGQ